MQKVRFTEAVDTRFGGIYVTVEYEAKAGDELVLDDAEVKRLNKHHPQLIKVLDKNAKPEDDEIPG